MDKKIYVTMTDTFLSGWGGASGRISKFVIICDNRVQAEKAAEKFRGYREMKYVSIRYSRPNYPVNKYRTDFRNFDDVGF